jgi:DNA (cytosine-5)-methyltransferase 1
VNVLSLFSGIGGIDLGLQRAGMTIAGQVETDAWCQAVLAKHWPKVPRHDDVATVAQWWYAGGPRPYVDLLAGGFPCQPISLAGQQLGTEDPRWLWPAMARAVRVFRPRYVLLENVPAIRGRGGQDVFADLAACGYDMQWDCIPASALGAPHQRDRWFAVAYPSSVATRNPIDRRNQRAIATRQSEPTRCDTPLPDPDSEGCDPGQRLGRTGAPPVGDGGWEAEPGVDRMAYGVPAQVDRLRGLGNAVVPRVAQYVGSLVMAWDRSRDGTDR